MKFQPRDIFAATTLALAVSSFLACGQSYPVRHQLTSPDCEISFTARDAHLLFAEFYRECYIACGDSYVYVDLRLDSGGYSRVEFSFLTNGEWILSDSFEQITVNPNSGAILDRVPAAVTMAPQLRCNQEPAFSPGVGIYIGAIDRCDKTWKFIPPQ